MGNSPVAVLTVIGIYVAFYAVYTASAADTYGLDEANEFDDQPGGILDVLVEIISTIWGFVTTLVGALTFNVDVGPNQTPAPSWVRIPVAIIIISSLTWSIVTLVRGN